MNNQNIFLKNKALNKTMLYKIILINKNKETQKQKK